jgi:pimeloyl-ACP methyl ester carboxylesterase
MNARTLTVRTGRRAAVAELGSGPPVLYLHDVFDAHGSTREWLPFHAALAESTKVIALAHAGCADSDEDDNAETPDDVVFHVLEALDALGIARIPVIGVGIGGWIAAELAVRHPDVVERLALVGATGLFVPRQPITDMFFAAQPIDGKIFRELRGIMFTDPDSPVANEHIPDGRMDTEREMLRYRTYRFANRLGFRPPYLYDRRLLGRLPRYREPALVVWGAEDRFVPVAHAHAYAESLGNAKLEIIPAVGHSLHLEHAAHLANTLSAFVSPSVTATSARPTS